MRNDQNEISRFAERLQDMAIRHEAKPRSKFPKPPMPELDPTFHDGFFVELATYEIDDPDKDVLKQVTRCRTISTHNAIRQAKEEARENGLVVIEVLGIKAVSNCE